MRTKTIPKASTTSNIPTIPRKVEFSSPGETLIIPLKKEILEVDPKAMSFKLRSEPANEKSITYSVSLAPFNTGSPEQWLTFMKMLKAIFRGQNLTSGPERFAMTKRLLEGNALSIFEAHVASQGLTETTANLDRALYEVTKDVFPSNALAIQKRMMSRFIKKPRSMKVAHFIARLNELNEQLLKYPGAEPDTAKISQVDLKQIIEFAIPNSWRKQMKLQQFVVIEKTYKELINFCKHMEEYKILHPEEKEKSQTGKTKSENKPANKKRKSEHDKSNKFCMYHRPGHSSEECKKLIAFVKKEKRNHVPKEKSKNSKSYSREEVYAMLAECKRVSTSHTAKRRKLDKSVSKTRKEFESFGIFTDSENESTTGTKSTGEVSDSNESNDS